LSLPAFEPAVDGNTPEECLFHALHSTGWAVIENFFPDKLNLQLLESVRELQNAQAFRPAGISAGNVVSSIRSDNIVWLDRHNPEQPAAQLAACLDQLQQKLNRRFFMGIHDFEMHAAVYPPGSFYRKHLDNRHASNRRIVTFILYLNRNWQAGDGGELVLYADREQHIIEPVFGRLVSFVSTDFYHEVLPANRERISVTGWFCRKG
jgi:SM-20-related protein